MNIIVTGAGKGIGFELANILSINHNVIAVSRNISQLNASHSVHPLSLDINNAGDSLSDLVRRKFDHLNILINNAGILINKPYNELSISEIDEMLDTNVKAPFTLIQKLVPLMSKGSHIVNIGSMGGFQGSMKFSGLSMYSASKAALAVLTECLAEELKEKFIQVNCLSLGATQTEMLSSAFPNYTAPTNANEMAKYIADFALEGNKYFNGKILPVSISTP
ncbi:MAG: SDR family oxidoreductase [Bacteroidota bacterium]